LADAGPNVILDDLLGLKADLGRLLKTSADLPRELAAIDVESSLPKLATLPATGADDDVFSTRNSIDAIFHTANVSASSANGRADAVDVLLEGFDDGSIHVRIFDSFEIGNIDLSRSLPQTFRGGGKIHCVASHPFLSTYFLLVEANARESTTREGRETTGQPESFHLMTLDLSFIPLTSHTLPLVATKATQLENLLRYLSQVESQLVQEIKAAFDLPTRFLRNVNDALAEHDDFATFVSAAHHLVVTGDCDPRLKEWLVDEVGERGLKRWEKAVGDCLDTVRRMMSECFLPALERCQVVLSRLDGLSKFGPTAARLGLDEKGIRAIRETMDVLVIVSEDMLKDVCVEIKEFTSFMKWLKWEAEVEAREEDSERAEELRETWSGENELRSVLDYVGGALQESRLWKYVASELLPPGIPPTDKVMVDDDPAQFYTSFKQLRRSIVSKGKRLPTLGELLSRVKRQSESVFAQIAETLRKSILTAHLLELSSPWDKGMMDIRVMPAEESEGPYHVGILSKVTERAGVIFYSVVTVQPDGGTSLKMAGASVWTWSVPEAEEILDAQFVDDTQFLVLVTGPGPVRIYSRSTVTSENEGRDESVWQLRHVLEEGRTDTGTRPARLEVNGRKGRRVVTVVDEAGTGYEVLDLESDTGGLETREDETGDEVMTG